MHARWRMSQRYAQPSPFFWLWLWLAVPLLFLRDPVAGLCTPQSRIPRTRPSNIPGPWQPMSPQQSRMTTLRKAEQMIYPRVRIPTPEELRSGRPMGREQLGLLGFYWLQREMRWLAQDYLLMAEEESLGYISVSEVIASRLPMSSLPRSMLHICSWSQYYMHGKSAHDCM
eukprot:5753149-Pleurochrysis_carterae.AAC.1